MDSAGSELELSYEAIVRYVHFAPAVASIGCDVVARQVGATGQLLAGKLQDLRSLVLPRVGREGVWTARSFVLYGLQ